MRMGVKAAEIMISLARVFHSLYVVFVKKRPRQTCRLSVPLHTVVLILATACLTRDPQTQNASSAKSASARLVQRSTAPQHLDPAILESREFGEAPQLRERVRSGDLPPVSERLPINPLVVVPIEEIGRYGGQIRRGLSSDISQWPGLMKAISENLLAFSRPMGESIGPNLAESWEYQDEGRVAVFKLRQGVKWSDGHPFTAVDVMFFYEDMLFDENARASDRPTPPSNFLADGKPIRLEKIDAYTIRFTSPKPMGRLLHTLGGADYFGWPKHILAKYHPRYNRSADYGDFQQRTTRAQLLLTPGMPSLSAWRPVEWARGQRIVFDRNPYYWKVDSAGNQLPYADQLTFSIIPDGQVMLLKFINGEIDLFGRGAGYNMYETLRAQEARGNYRLRLSGPDSGPAFYLNWDTPKVPLRAALRDRNVRIALSLAINREEIGEILYHGLLVPSGYAWLPSSPYFSEEAYQKFADYDPDSANAILDRAGYADSDGDGWREFHDGSRFEFTVDVSSRNNTSDICELISDHWTAIGIKVNLFPALRDIIWPRRFNGEFDIHHWSLEGPDDPLGRLSDWAITGPQTPFWHREAYRDTTTWLKEATEHLLLAQSTIDTTVRREHMVKARDLHVDNIPVIVVGSIYRPWGASTRLGNVPNDIIFAGAQDA
jgi:peptide/nickel transport system substrate-binding protein